MALQRSFANVWLDPGPLGLREFQEVTIPWEVKLAQCRLRLALPALGAEELGSVLEACTETLNQEHQEDNTAVAIARGRAGWLLDRLIPVMARADRPKEVFQLISRQLGQGNSKQAARSFQHVLRRLGPIDAQNALEAALQSRLKVAERVALLRDSSELGLFNGSDANFVALLESLYESHRDVGGAVLAALCKIGQTSMLKRVSQDDRSLYQLQVMLGQLQSTSGSFLGDEVASVLAMFCQRPGLGVQSLQVLSAWAQSRRTRDAGTVAQVASASSQALASKDEGLWAPAAGCLVSLAHLDSSPLTTIFCQLSAEVANLLRASSRLRVLTQRLLHAKASSEASEALVLAVVSAAFLTPSALALRFGLELWATCLHWNEPAKVLEALQNLPSLHPILLPVLLSSCSTSLSLAQQRPQALRETARALLRAETEPALVMLMAVVKFLHPQRTEPQVTQIPEQELANTDSEDEEADSELASPRPPEPPEPPRPSEDGDAAEFVQALGPLCSASASLQLLLTDLQL